MGARNPLLSADCYRMLVQNAGEMVIVHSAAGEIAYVNRATSLETGHSPSDLQGADISTVLTPETIACCRRHITSSLPPMGGGPGPAFAEGVWKTKRGRLFPVSMRISMWRESGETHRMVLLHGQSMGGEKEVDALLRKKDRHLREVHHRVKNNFQILLSMLDLDRMRATLPQVRTMLTEIQGRFYAMSLIHSHLNKSGHRSHIRMGAHLYETMEYLRALHDPSRETAVRMNVKEVMLPVDQSIPCALILTQLMSSAFKRHAAAESKNASIDFSIRVTPSGTVTAEMKDNAALPVDASDVEFRLLDNIIRKQLAGKWQLDRSTGTAITVRFRRMEEEGDHE